MRKAAPFVLLWLALHAAVLAVIAFSWGAAMLVKPVLGWLVHFMVLAALALTAAWLVMRVWNALEPRRTI